MIALDEGGNVWSWGANYNGELGREPAIYQNGKVDGPGKVEIPGRVVDIEAAYDQCFAITEKGHVYAWGGNSLAQLALRPQSTKMVSRPVNVLLEHEIESISIGSPHVLALTKSGKVLAWGGDSPSFIGIEDGKRDKPYNSVPGTVRGLPTDIIEVDAGSQFSLARSRSGEVFGWGFTEYGELGLDQSDPVVEPITLNVETAPHGVSAGVNIMGVYYGDGLLLRGDSTEGQRGCGGHVEDGFYDLLKGLSVRQVALGGFFGLALTTKGKVHSWGRGGNGQLGTRELENAEEETGCPRPIDGIPGMISVHAGFYASAAIDSTGRIWTWGSNELGELGRPDSIGTEFPVPPGPVVLDPSKYPKHVDFDL